MDTSGKDGALKKGLRGMNPKWLHVASFGKPTEEELAHHFLWRIRRQVPAPGMVGVFDRSHYEDVLVVRVRNLAPEDVWRPRYDEINAFERQLTDDGVTIVKVFLHIGFDYQRERQLRRLERIDKRWKFNPGDLDDRDHWGGYQEAYAEALERCSPPSPPGTWFPAIASGTAPGRSRSSCWRRCARWIRATRRARISTSRRCGRGCRRAEDRGRFRGNAFPGSRQRDGRGGIQARSDRGRREGGGTRAVRVARIPAA